jgi:outer membrane receptor protein involved in Fe transport
VRPSASLPAARACAFVQTLLLGVAPPALAAAQGATERNTIEEVVVTARGREERLQNAPDAITVVPLQAREVERLDDLANAVPGVFVIDDQDPGTNIITVRGVSTDRLQAASIAYVVDGVPLPDTELFTTRLFDVARFEVVKGPQGALFGKNAAGGAFNVVTAAPSGAPGGYIRAGLGSGFTRELEAAATGPLAKGVTGRLAVFVEGTDGQIENRTLGRKADFYDTWNLRGRVTAELPAGYALNLGLDVHDERGGAAYASSSDITGRTGGRLSESALEQPVGDYLGRAERQWGRVQARLAPADAGAGGWRLLAAYDRYSKDFEEELDYRPGPITLFGAPLADGLQPIRQPIDIEASTGEIRYVSAAAAPTRFIAGVFAQDVERRRLDDFGPLLFGAPAPLYVTDSLQTAAFGQVEHDFSARWSALAALRYDRDERSQAVSAAGAPLGRDEATFDAVQPKATLTFRPQPGALLYATYAEGFRTGGFNPVPGPSSVWRARFEPEVTRSLEAGAKLTVAGVRLDGAAYVSRIGDFQSYTFLENQSVTLNVDEVTVRGLELAFDTSRASWRLTGSAAVTEAEIDRYVAPDPILPGALRDYSGLAPANVPEWQWTLGAERTRRIPFGELRARADLNGVGRVNYTLDNVLHAPPRVTLDGRTEARFGRWTASAWVKNVTDERWALSAFGQTMLPLLLGLGPGGPFDTYTINRGREFGVTLEARF